jgi:hypothetical protein
MDAKPTKEEPTPTISLKHHQRILFEIRTKVAAINLDLGAYKTRTAQPRNWTRWLTG